MLELAGERTAGVHPYLVTPEQTAIARKVLGPSRLVAPEQGVVLESDPGKARELARKALSQYQTYPNYVNSWRRLGFSDEEISGASNSLVDALFAWRSAEHTSELQSLMRISYAVFCLKQQTDHHRSQRQQER